VRHHFLITPEGALFFYSKNSSSTNNSSPQVLFAIDDAEEIDKRNKITKK
jgi:hypothetical protein